MDQAVPRFVRIGAPIVQGPIAGSEVKCSGIIHFTFLEFLQFAASPSRTPTLDMTECLAIKDPGPFPLVYV